MGLKVFFFAFTLCTVGGALTLRWLALDFLYSAMDTFVPGIGVGVFFAVRLIVLVGFLIMVGAQGIGAAQLREIICDVGRGLFLRLHLPQGDPDAPLGQLPGTFAAG